eukprot:m51a1_g490 hypothetical protein (312) ;mRNA; f:232443-233896
MSTYYAGVETGGEHVVCAVAEGNPTNIIARFECKTTSDAPAVLREIVAWLKGAREQYKLTAPFKGIGIASFGPLDVNPKSPSYGHVTTTPKPGWADANILGAIKAAFPDVPMGFDTDVNAAALGEVKHGNPRSLNAENYAYVTVGTGVGVGVVVGGNPVHGLIHPEMGHVFVQRHKDDKFEGSCPFHGDCVEGMVASGALAKRLGIPREQLKDVPDTHPVWEHVAHQLAHLCAMLALTVSPSVIVLGGGIMNRKCLFPMIRSKCQQLLNGYLKSPSITTDAVKDWIVPATFGADTGVVGALELAARAAAGK